MGHLSAVAVTLLAGASFLQAAGLPLMDAVKKENAAAVRTLISQRTDVNSTEADGTTALHWAAQRDNLEIANLLIAAGAKVDAVTRYNITPLAMAANNGNAAMIERLLAAGADPNSTSREGQTALMTAAMNGRPEAVKMLLSHGAKIDAVEPFKGQTALMWAAGEGNADAIALLIEFGANVHTKSKAGFTPLLFAVRNDRIAAAKVLLDHGANVEDKAPDGTTALNMAAVNTYYDVGSLLLDYKADPNAADPRGNTLHTVAWLNHPGATWEAAALAEDPQTAPRPNSRMTALEFARKLLEHGADPNKRVDWKEIQMTKGLGTTRNPPNVYLGRHYLTFNGATPFYIAAWAGDAKMMRLLVEFKADPKMTNRYNVTPLMAAACLDYYEGESPGPFTGVSEAERLEAVKLALELGNPIDAQTDFGQYPMLGGTEFTLLTYPLNFNDLDDMGVGDPRWNGMTALHGAVISNQPSILQYLVDKGARLDVKNNLGWTPLMMTKGLFMANSKKEFPVAAKILTKAMVEKGLLPVETAAK